MLVSERKVNEEVRGRERGGERDGVKKLEESFERGKGGAERSYVIV